jgi:hypothetical protein
MSGELSKPQVGDTWYRYEDLRHADVNEFDDIGPTYVKLHVRTYKVSKVTPKGVWLSYFHIGGICRFVLLEARKRFAHPTKEDALESFKARKAKQIRILEKQLEHVRSAVWQAHREERELKPQAVPAELSDELDLV